jgi:hypothetical protein
MSRPGFDWRDAKGKRAVQPRNPLEAALIRRGIPRLEGALRRAIGKGDQARVDALNYVLEAKRRPIPSVAEILAAKSKRVGSCVEWQGYISGGYGRLRINGSGVQAHRASYEVHVGKIPDGLQLDHLCRNMRCINPQHLEPVTASENQRRGTSPASTNANKTHCIHGHEFSEENTERRGSVRVCRQCRRRRSLERSIR